MILESHQWAKSYLIFSAISVLQQKKLKSERSMCKLMGGT